MNWLDLVVLAIIIGFAIVGLKNGFVYSLFRVFSYFLSIIIAIKCYPLVSKILMKTALYTNIKASILKNLLKQQLDSPAANGEVKKAAADTVINQLNLPSFLKGTLINKMPNPTKLVDVHSILDTASGELAKIVIDIIALILLYILVRVVLIFARVLLKSIAKLPVFKQMDQVGGFALGAVEGLLTVYVLCALIMLFRAMPQLKGIFVAIDHSSIAAYFFQHNFIMDFMFPK